MNSLNCLRFFYRDSFIFWYIYIYVIRDVLCVCYYFCFFSCVFGLMCSLEKQWRSELCYKALFYTCTVSLNKDTWSLINIHNILVLVYVWMYPYNTHVCLYNNNNNNNNNNNINIYNLKSFTKQWYMSIQRTIYPK